VSAGPAGSVAVVDVGSNSVRLFLCTGVGPEGPEGERWTTITALKRGAGPDGRVSADALSRLDDCLAVYAPRVEAFGAPVLALGTSAVRDAPNRDEVAGLVRRRLGAPLRVLSGEEEAALAFRGARLALDGDEPALVVDIGGGSTELVRGGAGAPETAVSLPLGSVRSTERHLRSDPPRPRELRALRDEAATLVGPVLSAWPPAPVIGVAGTVTTLAAIRLGGYDPRRVDRLRLARSEVSAITARLAAMPLAERRAVAGLEPERAPVIVAGGMLADAVLGAAGADGLLVSERDLLDGAALAADSLLTPVWQ
jgi:exopolyphosphatase / guanosine-5'-triphosphate,3'-diphosphate pyrophosphatase